MDEVILNDITAIVVLKAAVDKARIDNMIIVIRRNRTHTECLLGIH